MSSRRPSGLFSFGRGSNHVLARWFWTVDRPLVLLLIILIGCGLVAVAAASPAAAFRLSGAQLRVDPLFFLKHQLFWVAVALPLMLATSLLPRKTLLRGCLAGFAIALLALAAVLVPGIGSETNGSRRWIMLLGFEFQPVEILKPFFIVTTAWLFSLRFEDRSLPALQAGALPLLIIVGILVLQPDYGQAALVIAVWLVQAMLAGLPLFFVGAGVATALGGLALAYQTVPHIKNRLDSFLFSKGDTFQIDRALDCFRSGGIFGTGPGEGVQKFRLPEAHTDYIFSVIGEEFGAITCLFLALLFLAILLRVLLQLLDEKDPFTLLAATGLTVQFAGQAFINMAVNLALAPSKGMTLPFISYGGSSYLATAVSMGFLLALTRRNRHIEASPYLKAVPA